MMLGFRAKKCPWGGEAAPACADRWSLAGGVGQQLAQEILPKAWFSSGSEWWDGGVRIYMGSKRVWKFIK